MYRRYEDPHKLEKELEKTKARLVRRQQEDPDADCWDLYETIGNLEERINFAWQDDEYDAQEACEGWDWEKEADDE